MIISYFPEGASASEPPIEANEVLNDNDWATISMVSSAGQAANFWAVGDTKQITINGKVGATTFSNLSIWAFIIGFDHNSEIEGSNTIHFQIGKSAQTNGKNLCLVASDYGDYGEAGDFSMNDTDSNNGGWKSSKMRTVLLGSSYMPTSPLSGSLLAALPADLRAVMKGVAKYTDNEGTSNVASSVTATSDYLWLLAEYEIRGADDGTGYGFAANSTERTYQKQYDYYAAGNSRIFYKHNATSKTAEWWLRSPRTTTTGETFLFVDYSGSCPSISATLSLGLAPAFCV